MSQVTNVILSVYYEDVELGHVREFSGILKGKGWCKAGKAFGPIEECAGGHKVFEANAYAIALNNVSVDELLEAAKMVRWVAIGSLQFLIKEQDDHLFRSYDLVTA